MGTLWGSIEASISPEVQAHDRLSERPSMVRGDGNCFCSISEICSRGIVAERAKVGNHRQRSLGSGDRDLRHQEGVHVKIM